MTAGFGEIDNAEAAMAEVGVTVVKYAVVIRSNSVGEDGEGLTVK